MIGDCTNSENRYNEWKEGRRRRENLNHVEENILNKKAKVHWLKTSESNSVSTLCRLGNPKTKSEASMILLVGAYYYCY